MGPQGNQYLPEDTQHLGDWALKVALAREGIVFNYSLTYSAYCSIILLY